MKMMRSLTILLLLAVLSTGCGNAKPKASAAPRPVGVYEYIVDTIDLPPDGERIVSELYDHFLDLIAGGELESATAFPADKRFCLTTETHKIFLWSYYISPNEMRGFEISIPSALIRRNGEHYVSTVPLVVDELTQKQTIKIIVMKEKPNQEIHGTQ